MALSAAQLRAFHETARLGSFTAAATRLGVTQSAVTQQVRSLEQRCNASLFVRHRRGVRLTPEGQALAALTSRWIDASRAIEDHLAGLSALEHGQLRIGCDSEAPCLALLSRYRTRWPNIQIEVVVGNSSQIWRALWEDHIEVAVVSNPPGDAGVQSMVLATQDLALWLPAEHPLAVTPSIEIGSLQELELVQREAGSQSRRLIEQLLKRAGIQPRWVATVHGREAMREAVRVGLGVGYGLAQELGDRSLRAPILQGGQGCNRVVLARRLARTHSRTVTALWEVADDLATPNAALPAR